MKAQTMRRFRQIHLYLGMLFAPAIIFFSVSGALQTFRLQEEKGYGGTPPAWIVWMASVHKDDTLPQIKPATDHEHAGPAASAKPRPAGPPRPSALAFKIFAVLMSIGLSFSALLGILIGLNSRATRWTSAIMLGIGVVLPIILLKS